MTSRSLTKAERLLARSMFGAAIDLDPVRIHHRRWWPFHPRKAIMAPDGGIWCHPEGGLHRDCFASASLALQALFIHEMTHVWQAQRRGRWYLPLMRHPFCRYRYALEPGKRFARYGIEQQAEIMSDAFLLARGVSGAGIAPLADYWAIIPFEMSHRPAEEMAK